MKTTTIRFQLHLLRCLQEGLSFADFWTTIKMATRRPLGANAPRQNFHRIRDNLSLLRIVICKLSTQLDRNCDFYHLFIFEYFL